jgi:protein-disulfide isomerase
MLWISSRRGLKVSLGFPVPGVQKVRSNYGQRNTSAWIAISGIVLALTVVLFTGLVAAGQENSAVVAEVNGDKLTIADLEQKEATELLQSRYKYYQAERKALDDLIDQHLLEMQARKENLTVDQLLQREVTSKLKTDPTEEQLRIYYEGVETDQPFEAMREQILQHIREARQTKARAAYLKSLRSQAQITIALASPTAPVEQTHSPVRGNRDAPVVLVEFADYQCPYCQKIHSDLEKLQKEYGNRLALVYKDYPLPMHPYAQKAAEAARCAGVQGKFWEFHDMLFTGKKLQPADLREQARTLNLDEQKFDKCVVEGTEAADVDKDAAEARSLGITGTPSFFINGHFFSGVLSYAALHDMVEQQLARSPSLAKGRAAIEPTSK